MYKQHESDTKGLLIYMHKNEAWWYRQLNNVEERNVDTKYTTQEVTKARCKTQSWYMQAIQEK